MSLVVAIRFTAPGGSVWLKGRQEVKQHRPLVEDTEIGISAAMLPKLLELFSRADDASAVAPSGMGIGLAVVREIVELHGGTVQARSSGPNKGFEFTV